MFLLISILIVIGLASWIFRYYALSLTYYLLVRLERRRTDFQLVGSLRDALVHERKKKIAGLEMIVSTWEKGEQVQTQDPYFDELLEQLRDVVHEQRNNLMAVTRDIWLWAKVSRLLKRIEHTSVQKDKNIAAPRLKRDLEHFQDLINDAVDSASREFSFTLNEAVVESVKIVRIEKSHVGEIKIKEELDNAGDIIRFSYDKFKDWQRMLTNLIRNAVEAVEAKRSATQELAAGFSLPGGAEHCQVKVSTRKGESGSVSVIVEDSGIGMDEATRSSFYKKGFTSGKEHGLGLGVTEESMQFINNYGRREIKSQKGTGTTITIIIDREKAQKAELVLPPAKPFLLTKPAMVLLVFLLIVAGFAIRFATDKYSRFWVDWNPAYAEVVDNNSLIVYNQEGKKLWTRVFQRDLVPIDPSFAGESRSYLIDDLNLDGNRELVVATDILEDSSGVVYCFNYKNREQWNHKVGKDSIYNVKALEISSPNTTPFMIGQIMVDDLVNNRGKEILIRSGNSTHFPNQLVMLDCSGGKIGEYWHPGAIPQIRIDTEKTGEKVIVGGGINNRSDYRAMFFVLEAKDLRGKIQAPPHVSLKQMKKAKEKVYLLFPHITDVDINWEARLFPVANLVIGKDGYNVVLKDKRNYFLGKNLELDFCEPAWDLGKFEREFDLKITDQDQDNWENLEVWENGLKVK